MSSILLPVFLLIAIGFAAARFRVVGAEGVKAVSDLAFMLFLPALLFRSMARTDFAAFPLGAPAAYFTTCALLFALGWLLLRRRGLAVREATIFGMSAVYSNLVMLGVPLVRLAWGETGLSVLLSLVALHSFVLLTLATLVVEFGERASPGAAAHWRSTLADVGKASVLHPVILPIIAGFAWAMTGWALPEPVDATLALIGGAAPTLCLILMGASLERFDLRAQLGAALRLTAAKSLLHPLATYAVARWVFGLDGVTLAVLTLAASLPVGANVYLLSQRYEAGFAQVSATVTLSTLATALTIGPLLGLVAP